MFSSIPGLYPLNTSGTRAPPSQWWEPKNYVVIPKHPTGGGGGHKCPEVRTTEMEMGYEDNPELVTLGVISIKTVFKVIEPIDTTKV